MAPNPDGKISEEAWSAHQALIYNLYVVKRHSLETIRQHLQDQRHFNASVDQYKRKLGKWGYHKNLKASTCKAVGQTLKRRQLSSTDAFTMIQGVVVSPRRLQRALGRHDVPSLRQKMALEQQPSTPDNVMITGGLVYPSALSSDRLPGSMFWAQAKALQAICSSSSLTRNHPLHPIFQSGAVELTPAAEYHPSDADSVCLKHHLELTITGAHEFANYFPMQESHSVLQDLNALITQTGKVDHFVLLAYAVRLCANNHLSEPRFDYLADYLLNVGNKDILKHLIRMKSICVRSFQDQLLLYAARKNRTDLLDLVVRHRDGVGRSDEWNIWLLRSIISTAIWHKSETFCLILLGDENDSIQGLGADLTGAFDLILLESAAAYLPSVFPLILSRVPAAEKQRALPFAVRARLSVDAISSLLNEGVDVDAVTDRKTALQYAIEAENIALIILLLGRNASTEAIHRPECMHHPESGPDLYLNEEKHYSVCPPILLSAVQNKLYILELLLETGADINSTDWEPWAQNIEVWFEAKDLARTSESVGVTFFKNAVQIAAWDNNIDLLELLLRRGAKMRHDEDLPSLVLAALKGCREAVEFLLQNGADIHAYSTYTAGITNSFRCNALQAACWNGDLQVIAHLISAGAYVNAPARGYRGRTALQYAVENDHAHVVTTLLVHGANINAPCATNYGITALQAAVANQNEALVRFLLSCGADVNGKASRIEYNAISIAIQRESIGIFWLLIVEGADLFPVERENGFSCKNLLLTAVMKGSIKFTQTLIDFGVDMNTGLKSGRSLAEEAIVRADCMDSEMLRLILEHTRSFNIYHARVAHALVKLWNGKDLNFLQTLIDRGHSIDPQKDPGYREHETFLQKACRFEHLEAVKLLLQHGADVNIPGGYYKGRTALAWASTRGNLCLVKLLIQHGATVNIPATEYGGRTALQAASKNGSLEVVKVLLQYGANVNSPASEEEGLTALQAAAWKGHLSIAQLLVANGADVGAPGCDGYVFFGFSDHWGKTALNAAALRGHLDIVQLLLDHYQLEEGDSLSAICDEAATHAREENKWAVVELLQSYQREPGSP